MRERSLLLAGQAGYPVNTRLPLLDDGPAPRPIEETIRRFLALYAVIACAYGLDRRQAVRWLEREGVASYVTPAERRFLDGQSGADGTIRDQVEALWALAWAMSLVPVLDFSQPCGDDFIVMLPDLKRNERSARLRRRAKPRAAGELLQALDTAYCLHWALRQAELEGRRPPGRVEPYMIVERRRALEWLFSDEEWDEVLLNT
jgi:hypothetical protein